MFFEKTNYEMNNKRLEQSVAEAQFSAGTEEKSQNCMQVCLPINF